MPSQVAPYTCVRKQKLLQINQLSRTLITIGLLLVIVGIAWPWLSRLGLFRLPGDIVVERENFHFYFPITTGILISIVISLILWLLHK